MEQSGAKNRNLVKYNFFLKTTKFGKKLSSLIIFIFINLSIYTEIT